MNETNEREFALVGGHAGITLLTTVAEPQSSVPLRPSSHAISRCTGIYSYREHQRSKLATDLTVGTAKELVSITIAIPFEQVDVPGRLEDGTVLR